MLVWVTKDLMRICWWPSAEWSDFGFLLCAQRGGNHSVWVLRHIGVWLCQMTKINCCSVKHHCFVRGSAEFKNSARAFSVHHVCRVWVFWKLWACQEVSAAGWTCTAFFQGEVLPCSPSQSPEGRFGCDGEDTSFNLSRASSTWCFGKLSLQPPCLLLFWKRFPAADKYWTKTHFWSWLIHGWFCVPKFCSSDS